MYMNVLRALGEIGQANRASYLYNVITYLLTKLMLNYKYANNKCPSVSL